MTAYLTTAPTSRRIRISGWLCLAAGILGAVSGVYLVLVSPAMSDDMWSYPLTPRAFAWIQAWFAVQHLGLVLGLLGLWWSRAVGPTRLGRFGHFGAVGGMAALALTEVAAIAARHDSMETATVTALLTAYSVVTLVLGAALIAEGVAVRKRGLWRGWRGWTPLALGVWVFVPMTPALALSYVGARLAISGWMLLFALLGWVLLQRQDVTEGV